MIIFVGSTNPVKINAVTQAASETWPEVRVVGVDVPSGVSAQPMTDQETKTGATNRARAAFDDGMNSLSTEELAAYESGALSVLGVGLEGGIEQWEDQTVWSTVWACVYHPEDGVFFASGAGFQIPDIMATRLLQGEELGTVAKQLANGLEVKKLHGVIGVLTKNFVDRTEEYSAIAKMALGLWYGKDWQEALD